MYFKFLDGPGGPPQRPALLSP